MAKILKALIISFGIFLAVMISALILLSGNKIAGVDAGVEKVPYKSDIMSESAGILVTVSDGYGAVIDLDFSDSQANVVILKEPTVKSAEEMGYTITEELTADYLFIMNFTDALGGLDMCIFSDDEFTRYTGVQVCNIMEVNKGSFEIKRKIIKSIFDKISVSGLNSEAVSCILNSETTISYPDLYSWKEDFVKVCSNVNIVN